MEEEKIIFEKLKSGDQQAFKFFFDKYYNSLCNFAKLILFDTMFVEEIVQDVFVEIWERRGSLTITTSVKSYLFTAVKNKSFNWNVKKINNAENLEDSLNDSPNNTLSPLTILVNKELELKINRTIESLPPQAKMAFQLKYIEGLRQKEISHQMKLSENTVEKHLSYARRYLRKFFEVNFVILAFIFIIFDF